MAEPVHGAASPEAAWRKSARQAEQGDYASALRWLERAVRLAPADPRIALDLANIRLLAGGPDQIARAATAFAALASRYDTSACWLGLLAARRLAGDHAGAAEALHELLSRHCVPEDAGFPAVAATIAEAAGIPGWCGMDAGGRLHFSPPAEEVEGLRDGAPLALTHLSPLPDCAKLTLLSGGITLLGSPIGPAILRRCEGIVETAGAALSGWVSRPSAPQAPPQLVLQDAQGRRRNIALSGVLPADADAPLTTRHKFHCPVAMLLDLQPPFRVLEPDGNDLLGSPIDPRAEFAAPPIPAETRGPANLVLPPRAALAVVVPVYRGLAVTQACLETVLHALPGQARLIVVDDASPEPGLSAWLDVFCRDARITLLRHTRNLGFPAAANAGLKAAIGCDVLLLNSDTLLPPCAIERLQQALYSRAELGSVTPFSNEATICSYPYRAGGNAAPDLAGTIALDAMAAKVNKNAIVEIPTGIGFCLLMRHDCIAKTGLFRPEIFAQGYGEEVDWCLRARHRGYIHVAATGVFVAHFSGASFGPAGRALNLRNSAILLRVYPGYDRLIAAHLTADPLAPARRLLDAARFAQARRKTATLLISHNHGGGVRRRVDLEMRRLRDAGIRPILLYPDTASGPYPHPTALTDNAPGDYPNLRFSLPEAMPELLRLLRPERIGRAVLHHGLGHHPSLRGIAEQLGCEMDIVVHDYASFCPRVHLIGPERRYCGEPDLKACAACVATAGDETFEDLGPKKLQARSRREFAAARQISAPSGDAARRIARHFPKILPTVTPWEDDGRRLRLIRPGPGHRRIAVIGGINPAKGYDVLLECGRDAARRNLALDFVIAGASLDDEKLLETGRIFITGPYRPAELPELLAGLRADLAFIPSIWPETWCFTLTEAWEAGLYTMAFDLGAQAERIAATGNGALLPLGLPPSRINDALLSWRPIT